MAGGLLAPGEVLGDRYQIRSQLGQGGMGEVWRAFDLKLRVEVALKALREDVFRDERRLELLRQEVRAAREVVSPNVCRIFDLIEADGSELVSMEYVDGQTLLAVLQDRGPLELKEAQDIASQFLAGLEAIHKAGLVHRDVKPENIMLTRAGRVVLMDFGLARQEDSGAGTVAGTPAYMAPEQAAGLKVDARADVYSAGVVLAEMVSPEGIKSLESRQSVWEGVRSEPAKLPDTPWAPVLRKAVAKEPDQRYSSAHTLTRALEDVTLRVEGAEDLKPYPGLASFTEADAEFFFGREAEIEQMWRRLEGPARLLAVVGPSGAGKTSFLRAGLIASSPPGWGVVRCTPGNSVISSLRRALIPELSGDAEVLQGLVDSDADDALVTAVQRWRAGHDHVLLIVDQFEELFTQNSSDDQARFAELLGKLALDADACVLLSLRDDFLMECNRHRALRPITSDLALLDPPTGANLRRALVQPATTCGYRFEDDELVDEMLVEVEGERGALPLLAFAAARLWEKRDREKGLITRQAYHDIGGVGGALARHAEATMERIGVERHGLVRELFRNLVTAEGTRAVREWDELLSVFQESQRQPAEEVLRELVDARLLTSYEVRDEDREPTRRVEIIHESLLANWPRLVRWQTQDREGAQLRDELRQAARSWDEHDRQDDRLWTGTAFREFQLWRERYPGGLSEVEEAFAEAITSFAMRRRRRRQAAVTAALVMASVIVLTTTTLWRRSVLQERRAEAQKLIALGQLELERYPTAAVAHAISSLELADTPEARRLALEALCKGPTALVVSDEPTGGPRFTPDGRWLVRPVEGVPGHLRIIGADGTTKRLEHSYRLDRPPVQMGPETGTFAALTGPADMTLWSVPEGRLLAQTSYPEPARVVGVGVDSRLRRVVLAILENGQVSVDALRFDGTKQRLGTPDFVFLGRRGWNARTAFDRRAGRWLGAAVDDDVVVIEIGEHGLSEPRRLGRYEGAVAGMRMDPLGRFIAAYDEQGAITLWHLAGSSPPMILRGPPWIEQMQITLDGSLLVAETKGSDDRVTAWVWSLATGQPKLLRRFDLGEWGPQGFRVWDPVGWQVASSENPDGRVRLWPMAAPADAEPIFLAGGWGGSGANSPLEFHPQGQWLATPSSEDGLAMWPLKRPYPAVIRRHGGAVFSVVFGPEGRWLASGSTDGTVRLWPLEGDVPSPGVVLFEPEEREYIARLAASPDGEWILAGTQSSGVQLLSRGGEPARTLPGGRYYNGVAFSADGRLAAAHGSVSIRVWDLVSGDEVADHEVEQDERAASERLHFTGDGRLLWLGKSGLLSWDPGTGERALLYQGRFGDFAVSADGRRVTIVDVGDRESGWPIIPGRASFLDLETGGVTPLETHGERVVTVGLDPAGTIVVTGDLDGVIRVGPVTGEEPHLLLGHERGVFDLAVDPFGRWIASGSDDTTVRLWPMPDLSKPPLHTLPREELIAKLKTLTNLRVVRDEESATGWKLTHDPFPGWETVPTW
jgi:WD40 repeat protein